MSPESTSVNKLETHKGARSSFPLVLFAALAINILILSNFSAPHGKENLVMNVSWLYAEPYRQLNSGFA